MNRKDGFLVLIILILAGILELLFGIRSQGSQVIITSNGQQYGIYDLHSEQRIVVNCDTGYNVVVIQDGSVFIEDANCPDKYCMKQGKMSDASKSLICLPHKLVVEVKKTKSDGESTQIDAVSQ